MSASSYSTYGEWQSGYDNNVSGLWASTFATPANPLQKFYDVSNMERLRCFYDPGVQAGTTECCLTPAAYQKFRNSVGWDGTTL